MANFDGQKMEQSSYQRPVVLFNTALEAGLRGIILLSKSSLGSLDLQRVVYYDYLSVHSGDVQDGPDSLHAAVPNRSGEMLIRRDVISRGLSLMISRQLAEKVFAKSGIEFRKSDLTDAFLGHFESDYFRSLSRKCAWVCQKYDRVSEEKLREFMDGNLGVWGAEFSFESEFRLEQ